MLDAHNERNADTPSFFSVIYVNTTSMMESVVCRITIGSNVGG